MAYHIFTDFIETMKIVGRFIVLLTIFLDVCCGAAMGSDISFKLQNSFRKHMQVLSWSGIRDQNIVKQKYDYSCGSGALATLMKIGFGEDVREEEIVNLILSQKSPEEVAVIVNEGYSLLDLKKAAEKKGYFTALHRLQIHQLSQLKGPVLIYFEPEGKRHFSVLKRVHGEKVYLADPASGNVRLSLFRFKEEWSGVIMAIDKR